MNAPPRDSRPSRPRMFWRVYLYGMLLVALIVTAFGVVGALFNRLASTPAESAEQLGETLAERMPFLLEDRPRLQRLIERQHRLVGAELTVYRLDGMLVATTVWPPPRPLDDASLERLSEGMIRIRSRFRLVFALPLPDAARPRAYVLVNFPLIGPLASRLVAFLAALLGTIALASIPFARAISSPLERLTSTARAFGQGDLSVRSGIRRRDEVGVLAAAFDEMADRLERLIRGEKELIANVSHELRTPLARIRVALELANEGDADRVRRALADVQSDMDELQRLVEDVLTAARLDAAAGNSRQGLPPLRREEVDPAELLGRCAERFREAHPTRLLSADLAPTLPKIAADPVLLRRAVDNLIDNARKYSDESQPIALTARGDGACLRIEVRDRGIGIDEADLSRLFTPFFRTDRSRARGTGGVGLGLALAKRIVEAHGGSLEASSVVGQGTVFRMSLPASVQLGSASRPAR